MSDSSDDERNEKLKFVILGACGSGKSSICSQYGQGSFKAQYAPTLGVDFFMKRISLSEDINVALQVWDLSGNAAGGNMLDKYLYGCHGILLVYDMTDGNSFCKLPMWLGAINDAMAPSQPTPKIMLVGNKVDQDCLRAIKNEEHMAFAHKNNLLQITVSAKTGHMIQTCFTRLASALLKVTDSSSLDSVPTLKTKSSGSGDLPRQPQQQKAIPLPPTSLGRYSSTCVVS